MEAVTVKQERVDLLLRKLLHLISIQISVHLR
jgi:hypothetical protein